ncbi:hypothetical protein NA57DRAFT_58020 [Rhizodiscina lignyota]|uniref:WW domain-containing protein n=1 Tax=Rhizodiscina lignyota TaxID=1504668 RepID=A0A9P4I924_9PEZI|nr:hypothetical protein NA57DRAFT_58020 [Rhizodiscina lignyota]
MADFAPPTGPPPPKVPDGWKAQWNDQYKEWFYVNIYTKRSQWERPDEPVYPPPSGDPDAPPSYDPHAAQHLGPEKTGLSSNNPYGPGGPGSSSHQDITEDERLARQLQEEENARGGGSDRGASDSYYSHGGSYGGSPQPQHYNDQLPPRPDDTARGSKGKGFLGKLLGGKSPKPQYGQQYPPPQQQSYYQGGPPQGQYGGPPPGQYGGPQYGGYPQQGYYQQPQYSPPPQQYGGRQSGGGGLGVGTAAALGVGGGLLGGVLLGEAIDGGDGGGDGGGDDGGGDGGGGDFGGGDF